MIGQLYRNRNVVTYFFGEAWVHTDPVSMVKMYRESTRRMDIDVALDDMHDVLQAFSELQFKNARFSLGKTTLLLREELLKLNKCTAGERRTSLRAKLSELYKDTVLENPMQSA